jgi:hypothetical protein
MKGVIRKGIGANNTYRNAPKETLRMILAPSDFSAGAILIGEVDSPVCASAVMIELTCISLRTIAAP